MSQVPVKNKKVNKDNKDRGPRTGGRPSHAGHNAPEQPVEAPEFVEKVVHINRCSKVVKGGRRFSFSALVVIGDRKGRVGVGLGKAKEVPDAIRKGNEAARKNMITISLSETTIPHEINGKSDGGIVFMKPASRGTGVVAGGGVRAVLEAVGVSDVLSKSIGSNNPAAMVKAALKALSTLRSVEYIKKMKASPTGAIIAA